MTENIFLNKRDFHLSENLVQLKWVTTVFSEFLKGGANNVKYFQDIP